ncbi:type 2 lanthipeptide synthetase LanM family protein [Micromonospora sp. WMMD1128]|uniref:type 2 lanthipeptide synthetase LanM family protein n=1 Tax=Micromonospora sp. WMMD1128 TaxID=3015150 RepID=UPI00248B08B3|nr:type 2 lanthipeptide synthetase LanM family protein [Micromonospora sp. WMMD1128]WBB76084.1 type 2 lanthipeptide synthetase LanM family protein [Micromonospora sp. WMMD1128]
MSRPDPGGRHVTRDEPRSEAEQMHDSTDPVRPGDAAWFLGHSLRERLTGRSPAGPVDVEVGRIRLKMWRDEPVHTRRPDLMARHLAEHGLDSDGLARMLGEAPETVRDRFDEEPGYARRLTDAWRRHPPADQGDDDAAGFATIAAPLVASARDRLRSRIDALVAGHPQLTAPALAAHLGPGPSDTLNGMLARVMALELNVLRVRGDLPGDDPHARFHHFLRRLRQPEHALALLREYPVLARDLIRVVDNWEAARLEFARRLVADHATLADRCGVPDALGDLAGVSFGAGDSHRGGRSVAVVRFTSGVRVMYKPRRLQVDRHFQQLLRWLDERGAQPPLRTFWVLDRGAYGWTEFVAGGPCADRDALSRFHRRQGALLALLQTLGATDFHLENVIAAGEHPMLIDLEAMLHNWQWERPAGDDDQAGYLQAVGVELMSRSAVTVGLLPAPVIWTEGNQVNRFDMSGMAGAGGQLTARPVAVWDGLGTDEMRLERRRVALPGSANLPTLGDGAVDVTEFAPEIVDGYRRLYRLLLAHRDELLAPAGPLAAFAGDEVRVVARATESYVRLLTEAHHPDLLRDALDRDRWFENLWAGHDRRPQRDALVAAELAQLHAGDVPIFVTTPSSTDLVAGDGSVLPGALRKTGLDAVRDRLAGMSEEHLAQQSWIIDASLTALIMGDAGTWRPPASASPASPAPGPVPPERYVDAARLVGDRLLATALEDGDRICWLGLGLVADRVWVLGPSAMDLYNGISGIALFLGRLASVTGDPTYRRAADRAATMMLREARAWLAAPVAETLGVGGFDHLGGSVYAFSHLAADLRRDDLLDVATRLAAAMVAHTADSREYDIISGTAGGLLALLSLHRMTDDPDLLAGAGAMARHLTGGASPVAGGLGWLGALSGDRPLAGFSHGASGIATALARWDRHRGVDEHRATVDAALRYEHTVYDDAAGNWRDLRPDAPTGDGMVAWCHGAAGIALARAELLGYASDDALVRADLRHALTALGDPRNLLRNHSICHGDLGNAEAGSAAAAVLGDDAAAQHAATVAAGAVADVEAGAWRCGVPRGVETPGLMSGLAGVGYAFLRRADPAGVPSVLLLEPPRDHRGAIDLP